MMPIGHANQQTALGKTFFSGVAILCMLGVSACQTKPPVTKPVVKPAVKAVDAQTLQGYYDRALQEYSKENYVGAQAGFQRVVDASPNSELGAKAQENLRKVQQILKTLAKIKAK